MKIKNKILKTIQKTVGKANREALQNVVFIDGAIYATDTYILVKYQFGDCTDAPSMVIPTEAIKGYPPTAIVEITSEGLTFDGVSVDYETPSEIGYLQKDTMENLLSNDTKPYEQLSFDPMFMERMCQIYKSVGKEMEITFTETIAKFWATTPSLTAGGETRDYLYGLVAPRRKR